MEPIACRSQQQIEDDSLIEAYDALSKDLSARTSLGLLYTGERRRRIIAARATLERAILGDEPRPSRPAWLAYHATHG